MVICKNCGVELEPDLVVCPLCGTPQISAAAEEKKTEMNRAGFSRPTDFDARQLSRPQRKAVWELISIILILLVLATSIINYIINKKISWSEYPVAVYDHLFLCILLCFPEQKKRNTTAHCF